jgi:hypothetical protein
MFEYGDGRDNADWEFFWRRMTKSQDDHTP